ncbi:MAG: hypothetical protein CMJ48_04035 [Planctomycetaceae bacterium]|nr:hypothetical protein [Planctomycetaceae bacterium]
MLHMQHLTKLLVLPLMVLVIISTATQAQDGKKKGRGGQGGQRGPGGRGSFGGGPGGFGGGGASMMGLLNNEKIQGILKVTDAQKTEMRDIAQASRSSFGGEAFRGLRDLPEEERRAKFEELRKKMEKSRTDAEKKIKGVLTDAQKDRLLGLIIQLEGSRALLNEDVAAKVGLDAEQKAIVKGALESSREGFGELFRGLRDLSEEERRAKFEELRKKMEDRRKKSDEEALAVLSPEQKKKFESLKGEAVEGLREALRGRRPGGTGGDRGRRPGGDNGGRPRRPGADSDL